MTLVRGFGGRIHRLDCKTRGDIYKVLAPELPESDVADFLRARGLEGSCCRVCLRSKR